MGFDTVFDCRYTLACQRKIETVLFFETSMYTPNSTVIYGVENTGQTFELFLLDTLF